MKLTDQIRCIFDDAAAGKPEAALLHACTSIDATAKRLYPANGSGVRARFVRCIREYYWLIEPMMGVGFNLEETIFSNLTIPNLKKPPDFADVIYAIHRNSHAHGDEVHPSYELIKTTGPYGSQWEIGADHLRIPDRVIWALASVTVFCRVNFRHRGWGENRYLTWGEEKFVIVDWWGREADLKPVAVGWNTTRVKMEKLERLKEANERGEKGCEQLIIAAPPPEAKAGSAR
jgi:hypothetical protein